MAQIDRDSIGERERVYALAKKLGMSSKDVVVALAEIGVAKVAQSTLTKDEVFKLLDHLEGTPEEEHHEEEAEEKLRERIRKNVDNEIHQIEQKVEASLPLDEHLEEPLEEVTPEVTPAPEGGPVYAPLFQAPHAPQPAPKAAKEPEEQVEEELDEEPKSEEPVAIKGSTRLEAQRRRRSEMREVNRKRKHTVTQAEFLARRESVERTMVVRERPRTDGAGTLTQVGVLEDNLLVEHFVTSESQASSIGNIYLGRVQNVLSSMEAAFIDIGTGRNGVLYASDLDWKAFGDAGKSRRFEKVLKSGDQVLVQISKDPIGHKGSRLTTQISLAGRYLVYVPGGRSAGISRKLPAPERKRLKDILARVIPGQGGAIIRTAAENVPEEAIAADVKRLHDQWEDIYARSEESKAAKGAKPIALYEEPDMLVKVVRDLFNEDFTSLIVDGRRSWNTVSAYVHSVAPDLEDRLVRFDADAEGEDAFAKYRIDEQLHKALSRKVWLPSGGTLIIDRTEAMTVIDVNTGKFTGSGGNLEETVTRNNLEAAEEIVRQMRLRDLGGMIVIDFIDMVLPENQELVLRRLKEALGRDRTRHQVSEVTSLGLVQVTRKRLGTGLLETFSTVCETCHGRGLIIHDEPVEHPSPFDDEHHGHHEEEPEEQPRRSRRRNEPKKQVEPSKVSDEDLVAAVIAKPHAEPKDPTPEVPEWERIASEAVETAAQADDIDEFNRSPRRRRATRGNSRSDFAPVQADPAQETREPKPKQEPEAPKEKQPGQETSSARRRRRRAVRKTAVTKPAVETREKKEPAESETAARPRKRRAVRRRVR